MIFQSIEFLIFFASLLIVLLLIKNANGKKILLITFSYIFYAWWNPAFIALLLFSTVVNYWFGHKIYEAKPERKKFFLILSLIINLLLLGFFKYFNFFQSNLLLLSELWGYHSSWVSINVILPIAISFFTFEVISYNVDVYKSEIKPPSALDFFLFISFFPRLVAGPIVRPKDFLPQLQKDTKVNFEVRNLLLITRGFVKKIIIADNLSSFVDTIFTHPSNYPSVVIWIAAIAFAIQIYCDFSGYTDIARGLALTLGYELPLNFDRPYFATAPSEFWKRWHISLSSWLRDYLYIPLGGNRKSNLNTYRNLFITMALGGLWHGANWNFLIWGALHGLLQIVYRLCHKTRLYSYLTAKTTTSVIWRKAYNTFSFLLFQYLVLVTWITFRITDISKMWVALKKFICFDFDFNIKNMGLGSTNFFNIIIIICTFITLHTYFFKKGNFEDLWSKAGIVKLILLYVFLGVLFFFLWPSTAPAFIYFQF